MDWAGDPGTGIFCFPLADLDFNAGAPVKKITMSGGETYNGNAASKFMQAEPFRFLPADLR